MEKSEPKFAVLAEKIGYSKPLYLVHLSFARLMDDVVIPYQSEKPFFIDGVPIERKDLARIKIVQQDECFGQLLASLHYGLRSSSSQTFVEAKDYPVRLDALLREAGDDVTSQVIKAYELGIGPRLKEYLPKREEIISAALALFVQGMKQHSN